MEIGDVDMLGDRFESPKSDEDGRETDRSGGITKGKMETNVRGSPLFFRCCGGSDHCPQKKPAVKMRRRKINRSIKGGRGRGSRSIGSRSISICVEGEEKEAQNPKFPPVLSGPFFNTPLRRILGHGPPTRKGRTVFYAIRVRFLLPCFSEWLVSSCLLSRGSEYGNKVKPGPPKEPITLRLRSTYYIQQKVLVPYL